MGNILCLDIGNTFVKWAVFNTKGEVLATHRQKQLSINGLSRLVRRHNISGSMLSTTRDLSTSWLQSYSAKTDFLILDTSTPIPIANQYKTPKTLGKDRVAAAVAAHDLSRAETIIVIDAGTCITLDIVSQDCFIGGNISPGIYMRSMAMHKYTDKLPLVPVSLPAELYGVDTYTALQNGAVRGTILEVHAFIERVKAKYRRVDIFITGGDGTFLSENLNYQIFADPLLVLKGLFTIYKYQKKN